MYELNTCGNVYDLTFLAAVSVVGRLGENDHTGGDCHTS